MCRSTYPEKQKQKAPRLVRTRQKIFPPENRNRYYQSTNTTVVVNPSASSWGKQREKICFKRTKCPKRLRLPNGLALRARGGFNLPLQSPFPSSQLCMRHKRHTSRKTAASWWAPFRPHNLTTRPRRQHSFQHSLQSINRQDWLYDNPTIKPSVLPNYSGNTSSIILPQYTTHYSTYATLHGTTQSRETNVASHGIALIGRFDPVTRPFEVQIPPKTKINVTHRPLASKCFDVPSIVCVQIVRSHARHDLLQRGVGAVDANRSKVLLHAHTHSGGQQRPASTVSGQLSNRKAGMDPCSMLLPHTRNNNHY